MVVVGPLEVRQQGLEGGHRQAGQLLEDSGSKAELLEVQHARAPRSRRKGIAYSKDDLIPIKSIGNRVFGRLLPAFSRICTLRKMTDVRGAIFRDYSNVSGRLGLGPRNQAWD